MIKIHQKFTNQSRRSLAHNNSASLVKSHYKSGFTVIELTIAIAFLSLLLLSITFLIFHTIVTYQKGMAIKAISSTGRELIDDLSRTISLAPAKDTLTLCSNKYNPSAQKSAYDKCISDGARKFIYQQRYGRVAVKGIEKDVPVSGAFCSGRYTYLWSTGYTMNDHNYPGGSIHRAIYTHSGNQHTNFRLLKIEDSSRAICSNNMSADSYMYETNNNRYNVNSDQGVSTESREMLSNTESNLAIYSLDIFHPSQHQTTMHSFYSGTFILATIQGGVDITGSGNYCNDAPGGLSSDFAYCAINKFNFAMRATGELRKNER